MGFWYIVTKGYKTINSIMEDNTTKDNPLSKLGVSVEYGNVEVGQTYPIYGAITEILNDTPGSVVVTVNYNIQLNMQIEDAEKIELLKDRAFDVGIFVSTITQIGDTIRGDCTTVVFGKRPEGTIQ